MNASNRFGVETIVLSNAARALPTSTKQSLATASSAVRAASAQARALPSPYAVRNSARSSASDAMSAATALREPFISSALSIGPSAWLHNESALPSQLNHR